MIRRQGVIETNGSIPIGLLEDADDAVALVERQRRPAVEWETTMEVLERLADGLRGRDPATVEAAVRRLDSLAGTRVAVSLGPSSEPPPPPVLELRNRLITEIGRLREALGPPEPTAPRG
jgi:hypothetical protein